MSSARWTGDTRGRGVSGASAGLPAIDRFRGAMTQQDWVAEQPEVHVLPHIVRACEAGSAPWTLLSTTIEGFTLVVNLAWHPAGKAASMAADAMALIGAFAEARTFVHQLNRDGETVFEVTTGMLDDDGPFAGHGHLVRLIVHSSMEKS